jgi:hypothetical protein
MVGYHVKLTDTLVLLDLPHLRLWLDVSLDFYFTGMRF